MLDPPKEVVICRIAFDHNRSPFQVEVIYKDKDDEPGVFKCVAGSGFAENIVGKAKYRYGEGFTGSVAQHGGEYNINGGAYTSASGSLPVGGDVIIRVLAPTEFEGITTATLTAGDATGDPGQARDTTMTATAIFILRLQTQTTDKYEVIIRVLPDA